MDKTVYLINANLITMEEKNYENGYIVINSGKIKDIGDMAQIGDIPKDAEIIDAEGNYVTPGLVDAHTHIGMWEDGIDFEGADGNEDTDPTMPQLRAIDGVNPQDRAFKEALSAGITSVVTGPGSANPIGGQLLAMKTFGVCVDDMVISDKIGIKAAFGENPKGAYNEKDETPTTRMGTAAIIREALFKAREYMADVDKYNLNPEEESKPDFEFKCDALLPVLRGKQPLYAHAHRLDDIFTAIRICREFNIRLVLVHGTEAHLAPERIVKENIPILSGPILNDRSKPELKNQEEYTPAVLTEHKIKTALITDHPETPEKFLTICAATAVREGMDADEALRAITIVPAEICGIDDRVGSLKIGKDGDVVIWQGDPTEFNAKPKVVICDGEII